LEYEIAEVRVEGDRALLVLRSDHDSFGIDISFQKLQSLSESKLEALIKEKIRERLQLLADIRREEEESQKKLQALKHLVGRKIKLKRGRK